MRSLAILCAVGLGLTMSGSKALATAQRGDILVIDGEERSIQTNPLEPFLEIHAELRPRSEIISTGLWRRYVATWTLSDGRLTLIDVQAHRQKPGTEKPETELYSVMSEVFPGRNEVFAEWFTGYIIVPRGDLVQYVHMGYASVFENYIVLTVIKGHLEDEERMTSTEFQEFRRNQFRAYQETEEYKSAFRDLKDDSDTLEETESFLFRYSSGRYTSIIFDHLP